MYNLYIMEGRKVPFTIFGNKILITTKLGSQPKTNIGNYEIGNKLIEISGIFQNLFIPKLTQSTNNKIRIAAAVSLKIRDRVFPHFLYSFFHNCLFRILNDCHRINLDNHEHCGCGIVVIINKDHFIYIYLGGGLGTNTKAELLSLYGFCLQLLTLVFQPSVSLEIQRLLQTG